ncbi:hypothetical protein SARC_07387 [Sphaeroforma arctica JP610]|uniref:Uncharacterized protein n=1 Tax=Sphaeroforma arctica JP610 TaxID=667725 RepID=A0A0L0FUA7_9EUKA|nr:hypothetical protein SARC_07387 [Sphaeroforma arctica JP610]KNC80249.1 hypothetical protein SARC_07387 [Sphaeroforma arctica JP610]|eukprot:XP_014154151.1 hypothetical protein SARC_07387 [Sphaeroforma arctica JP610]
MWKVGNTNVRLGRNFGSTSQGSATVAIGNSAGETNQNDNSIAIGHEAGWDSQGVDAIVIGTSAGYEDQHDNTIVLNASGSALNTEQANSICINPVRESTHAGSLVRYNESTSEMVHAPIDTVVDGKSLVVSGTDFKIGTFVFQTLIDALASDHISTGDVVEVFRPRGRGPLEHVMPEMWGPVSGVGAEEAFEAAGAHARVRMIPFLANGYYTFTRPVYMALHLKDAGHVQLYAAVEPSLTSNYDESISSSEYNNFSILKCTKPPLLGEGEGLPWINENTFYVNRINDSSRPSELSIIGSWYAHNHNYFYGGTIEGDVNIYIDGNSNYIHNLRLGAATKSVQTIVFSDRSKSNYIEREKPITSKYQNQVFIPLRLQTPLEVTPLFMPTRPIPTTSLFFH